MPSIRDVVMAVGDLPEATPAVFDPATLTVILSPSATPDDVARAWTDVRSAIHEQQLRCAS